MDQPVEAPDQYFNYMMMCWNANPEERPTFETLEWQLAEYFELEQGIYMTASSADLLENSGGDGLDQNFNFAGEDFSLPERLFSRGAQSLSVVHNSAVDVPSSSAGPSSSGKMVEKDTNVSTNSILTSDSPASSHSSASEGSKSTNKSSGQSPRSDKMNSHTSSVDNKVSAGGSILPPTDIKSSLGNSLNTGNPVSPHWSDVHSVIDYSINTSVCYTEGDSLTSGHSSTSGYSSRTESLVTGESSKLGSILSTEKSHTFTDDRRSSTDADS